MSEEEHYSIDYGQQSIDFSVRRRDRKTLAISVLPDLSVQVVSPLECSEDAIKERVQKRARWILAKRRWFAQFHPGEPTRFYVSGETHRYLGKRYRLKIAAGEKVQVRLYGGHFNISGLQLRDSRDIMIAMDNWYREQAVIVFEAQVRGLIEKLGLPESPKIVIRKMNKRWGSVAPSGVMTFNLKLIQAPMECIEYVVAHEVCHLLHFSHTKEFYATLANLMPDWERRKLRLEKIRE